jgi:hypothetical protein
MRSIFIFCSPIIACNKLNANEAELVYLAVNTTMGEISDMAIEMDEEEVNINETLSSTWEGNIEAYAERITHGNTTTYPLLVAFTDVYVPAQRITLNGALSVTTDYFLDPTNLISYQIDLSIKGELTVTGDANGIAEIQYSIEESYDIETDRTSLDAQGTINGHDVNKWYY